LGLEGDDHGQQLASLLGAREHLLNASVIPLPRAPDMPAQRRANKHGACQLGAVNATLFVMKEDSFDDELFGYFKDRYGAEAERSKSLIDRMNLGVTILSILGGFAGYYLASFKFDPFDFKHLFFYVPFGLGVLSLLKALWHFKNCLATGWRYNSVPDAKALGDYVDEMKAANDSSDPDIQARIRAEFIKSIGSRYKECAAVNYYINIERQTEILRAYKLAMLSLALFLITSVPFFVLKSGFQTDTTQVTIIKPVEIKK
jgi:hypothetical protein